MWRFTDITKKQGCLDKTIMWQQEFTSILASVCIMEHKDIDQLGANIHHVQKNRRKANENIKGLILDIDECFTDAKVVDQCRHSRLNMHSNYSLT